MVYGKGYARMPDLTRHIAQQCAAAARAHTRRVPSSSGSGEYTVWVRGVEATCTCPAGRFRGTCRHIQAVQAEVCTWHGSDDAPQTLQQEVDMTCPGCGGPTVYAAVAA